MHDLLEVIQPGLDHARIGQISHLLLMPPAPAFRGASVAGNPACDPVQPTGEGRGMSDRTSLSRQDKERRLKRILGVVSIAQDCAADTKYHGPMAFQQYLESALTGLALPVHELFDELLVARVAECTITKQDKCVSPCLAVQSLRQGTGLRSLSRVLKVVSRRRRIYPAPGKSATATNPSPGIGQPWSTSRRELPEGEFQQIPQYCAFRGAATATR
jgi:hypothetical protein